MRRRWWCDGYAESAIFFLIVGVFPASWLMALLILVLSAGPPAWTQLGEMILFFVCAPLFGIGLAGLPAICTGLFAARIRSVSSRALYVASCGVMGCSTVVGWLALMGGRVILEWLVLYGLGAGAGVLCAMLTLPDEAEGAKDA